MEGSPRWFPVNGSAATIWPAASAPCWAKATSGESIRTMHWIDSMMVWSCTALKSIFKFWTILLLGVWALDALDPLMVGYLLELLWEFALVGPTILMRQGPSRRCPRSQGSLRWCPNQEMLPKMSSSMFQRRAGRWVSRSRTYLTKVGHVRAKIASCLWSLM
jgi:hypothetical protein